MAQSSGNIEPITTIPDEQLFSISQIDLSILYHALYKKPTYKAYKTLLVHRRTLQYLSDNIELGVNKADDDFDKASGDLRTTIIALADACDAMETPYPITRPPLLGEVLRGIIELQKLYRNEKEAVLVQCLREQSNVAAIFRAVKKRVGKLERALVRKFGVPTVDDEGNPLLNEYNVERIIDVMVSVPRIKDL